MDSNKNSSMTGWIVGLAVLVVVGIGIWVFMAQSDQTTVNVDDSTTNTTVGTTSDTVRDTVGTTSTSSIQ